MTIVINESNNHFEKEINTYEQKLTVSKQTKYSYP